MALEISKEQINEVIDFIKKHIDKKNNCRVGWALRMKIGVNYGKSMHNIEKVANGMIQTKEYIKERSLEFPKDYNILKNPEYKKETFIEKHPFLYQIIIILITAIVSIASSVIVTNITTKTILDNAQQDNTQDKQIEHLLSDSTISLSKPYDKQQLLDSID